MNFPSVILSTNIFDPYHSLCIVGSCSTVYGTDARITVHTFSSGQSTFDRSDVGARNFVHTVLGDPYSVDEKTWTGNIVDPCTVSLIDFYPTMVDYDTEVTSITDMGNVGLF